MKFSKLSVLTLFLLPALIGFLPSLAMAEAQLVNYRTDEILVRYKPSIRLQSASKSLTANGFSDVQKLLRAKNQTSGEWLRVKIAADESVQEAIARIKKDPQVELAQPNFKYRLYATANDSLYSHLWGLKNSGASVGNYSLMGPGYIDPQGNPGKSGSDMNLETAWDRVTDCSGVVVAIIDTGVRYTHEDLQGNMWDSGDVALPNHGFDIRNNDNNPTDDHGHGTHVAGTIGAVGNNATGTTGVCWDVKLMAVKVFDAAGEADSDDIAQGIIWAVDHGAKVINMSLGGSSNDPAVSSAMNHAVTNGVVTVSAAGNESANNSTIPSYPCNYRTATNVCVAALRQDYQLADFSNYSSVYVDIGAPGVNIVSPWWTARTEIPDTFASGWTYSTNTASAWGAASSSLYMPSNWDGSSVNYANSTTATAYKSFNLSAYADVWLQYYVAYKTASTADYVRPYFQTGSVNPVTSGDAIEVISGTAASPVRRIYDLTEHCAGETCSFGYSFISNSSGVSNGFAISQFKMIGFSAGNDGYNIIEGTSMATPHVAGLAALVWSYNPGYTAAEVVNALKFGGRATASLAGKTTTGNAADAAAALAYIQAPKGLSAVQGP